MERNSNLLDEVLGIFNNNNNNNSTTYSSSSSSSCSSVIQEKGSVIVIKDCVETSGAFVIHHLLKRYLTFPHSSFIFFSLSHPFSHYDRILRKLGCNLAAHRDNKRFMFFDLLMLGCSDGDAKGLLIEMYGKIQKVVEDIASSGGNSKHITIVIDDFSLIEVATKGSFNQTLDFLRYCFTLTSEYGCSLVILTHEDIYSEEENSRVVLQMEYLANILIKAEPLATGLAADVHGQLTVLNKATDDTPRRSSTTKLLNFHFKIKENGVECFYPGKQT